MTWDPNNHAGPPMPGQEDVMFVDPSVEALAVVDAMGSGKPANLQRICLALTLDAFAVAAVARARAEAIEECATIARSWQRADAIRLAAGEMTAQEMRTARAIARAVEVAISMLARKPRP